MLFASCLWWSMFLLLLAAFRRYLISLVLFLIHWTARTSLYQGRWSGLCHSYCWVPQEGHGHPVILSGGASCWILGIVRPGYASCGSSDVVSVDRKGEGVISIMVRLGHIPAKGGVVGGFSQSFSWNNLSSLLWIRGRGGKINTLSEL